MMLEIELTSGNATRLKRLMELKKMTDVEAVQYAISAAWLLAENAHDRKVKS